MLDDMGLPDASETTNLKTDRNDLTDTVTKSFAAIKLGIDAQPGHPILAFRLGIAEPGGSQEGAR
jgi:hypothetical protein